MQKLKDLMSRDVKVISFDMTIRDAAKKSAMGTLECCQLERTIA